jgi:hypothetical protein
VKNYQASIGPMETRAQNGGFVASLSARYFGKLRFRVDSNLGANINDPVSIA